MYPDDKSLIAGLINKDEAAYRQAVSTYHSSMLSLARQIAGHAIADEIVQEAWLSVIASLPQFEGRSSLTTWILRIVANEAKTRQRREKRSVSLEEVPGESGDLAARFDSEGRWLAGREPAEWGDDSPEALLSRDELRECIDVVIANLPHALGATLHLREHQGYSFKEICNILAVSESNVRVMLHRARTRLYSAVELFEATGECKETRK